MADPATRIVSLTVTEGGYNVHPVTGEFDAEQPAVRADLQPGRRPATTFGLVTEALVRRRSRGSVPFTIMSCDNIQGNGHVAAAMLRRVTPGCAIPTSATGSPRRCAFPNSMVDRITPVTTDDDRAELAERFDITTAGRWCASPSPSGCSRTTSPGRPPLEQVGVQVVDDVEPYELMKLRLLNAESPGAVLLRLPGRLPAGARGLPGPAVRRVPARVHGRRGDADPGTRSLASTWTRYKPKLIERFSNATVRDTVARLCAESSDRIPKWLLPVIQHNLAARPGDPFQPPWWPAGLATPRAWTNTVEPIEVVDRLRDTVMAAAQGNVRIRWPSSPMASCSVTSSTTPGSPSPTWRPWRASTPWAPAPPWSPRSARPSAEVRQGSAGPLRGPRRSGWRRRACQRSTGDGRAPCRRTARGVATT